MEWVQYAQKKIIVLWTSSQCFPKFSFTSSSYKSLLFLVFPISFHFILNFLNSVLLLAFFPSRPFPCFFFPSSLVFLQPLCVLFIWFVICYFSSSLIRRLLSPYPKNASTSFFLSRLRLSVSTLPLRLDILIFPLAFVSLDIHLERFFFANFFHYNSSLLFVIILYLKSSLILHSRH
jgi:hypothetical protein